MNKKEFLELIENNKDKFKGLLLEDATLRYGYPHCAIKIFWHGTIEKSYVKVLRCKHTDLKALNELNKYKRWANIL